MARRVTAKEEVLEGEVIIAESAGGTPGGIRQLRVYDKIDGDFLVDIPSDARVTFGYFNPAVSGAPTRGFGGYSDQAGPGSQTMKTTALRIYQGKENQIAVFLGVSGFRDSSLKVTRLTQKVTISTNVEDDGVGNVDLQKKVRKALAKVDDDDVPF